LTLTGTLTIGIPAFFLSLAPNAQRARPGFISRVGRFAVPGGVVAAAATLVGYVAAAGYFGATLEQGRTVATGVLFSIGLVILADLSRPVTPLRVFLLGAMTAAFALVLALPMGQSFFALVPLPANMWLLTAAIVVPSAAIALAFSRHEARQPTIRNVPCVSPPCVSQ